MNVYVQAAVKLLLLSAMLLGLPLLGVALTGGALAPYLRFPPQTGFAVPPPFAWPAFVFTAAVALALFGALAWLLQPWRPAPSHPAPRRLPWWGWAGALWVGVAWALAWSPLDDAWGLSRYSFTAIWLGYIVLVNALAWRRSGRSLLTHRPGLLAALFPFSALFWWYFEYLNRFVQNWHYVGAGDTGPGAYVLHASLAFSTVLPAVISTQEWLRTFPRLRHTRPMPRFAPPAPRRLAATTLVLAALALAGLGLRPDWLYPLVWAAPLVLFLALQTLLGAPSYLRPVAEGRWEVIALPALAALCCGVLWELWNVYSLPKWEYSVPYVHRFEVFEMPLLGFTGYLPFGLECAVVADFVARLLTGSPRPVLTADGLPTAGGRTA